MGKKRIAFDFDGVINSYKSGWQGPGVIKDAPVEGIDALLRQLQDEYEVVIMSSRCASPEGSQAVSQYLSKYHIPYDMLTSEKVPALMYVDDRAVLFDGNIRHLQDQIKGFKPWWQKR